MQHANAVPVHCDFCDKQALYTQYVDASEHGLSGLPSKYLFFCEKHRRAFKRKVMR